MSCKSAKESSNNWLDFGNLLIQYLKRCSFCASGFSKIVQKHRISDMKKQITVRQLISAAIPPPQISKIG